MTPLIYLEKLQMPEITAKKKVRFVGWWRKDAGSPWRRLVQGDGETDVLNRLLNADTP